MKILLIGEYSNLHNSLKKGLVDLGHDVKLISTGDGFKGFGSDILISKLFIPKYFNLLKKIFGLVFRYPFRYYYNSIKFQKILQLNKSFILIQINN